VSLQTFAECDNPKCNTSVRVLHRAETAFLGLEELGWIIETTTIPSTIAAGRVTLVQHFCTIGCQVTGNANQRARQALEAVRR